MSYILQQLRVCIREGDDPFVGKEARKKRKADILQRVIDSSSRVRGSDLANAFPEVSRCTVLADIKILIDEGRLERAGHGYVRVKVRGGMV